MPLRKPKLLFIAYYFPPREGSGCVRSWNIAKHLARRGWQVTVVTPHPSLWRHVEAPEAVTAGLHREGIRRLTTGHTWRCLLPDDLKCRNTSLGWVTGGLCRAAARRFGVDKMVGWSREAERACASLAAQDVDVILASGPPFVSFKLAKTFSERWGCPYVLDYRDPWIPPQRKCSASTRAAILCEEAALVKDSSAVTVISPSLSNGPLSMGPKRHVISNGFDPEELAEVAPFDFGHFAIVYAGTFYPPLRVVTPIMEALRRLNNTEVPGRPDWRFHYYGPHGGHVRDEAEKYGVGDKTVLHGHVPRAQALSAVRGAGVAVVITAAVAEIAAKLFEPLGMNVPVLLVGPSGSDVDGIVQTAGVAHKVAPNDVDGMVWFLEEVMAGKAPSPKQADAYAWPNLVESLDAVLRGTIRQGALHKRALSGAITDREHSESLA